MRSPDAVGQETDDAHGGAGGHEVRLCHETLRRGVRSVFFALTIRRFSSGDTRPCFEYVQQLRRLRLFPIIGHVQVVRKS